MAIRVCGRTLFVMYDCLVSGCDANVDEGLTRMLVAISTHENGGRASYSDVQLAQPSAYL